MVCNLLEQVPCHLAAVVVQGESGNPEKERGRLTPGPPRRTFPQPQLEYTLEHTRPHPCCRHESLCFTLTGTSLEPLFPHHLSAPQTPDYLLHRLHNRCVVFHAATHPQPVGFSALPTVGDACCEQARQAAPPCRPRQTPLRRLQPLGARQPQRGSAARGPAAAQPAAVMAMTPSARPSTCHPRHRQQQPPNYRRRRLG